MARAFDLHAFAYAHRGLWAAGGAPENSVASFRAAAGARLGIEFDLRPASGGEPMVFHDPLLDRMTAASGVFEQKAAADLKTLKLGETAEPIPSFEDLLDFWPQTLPLLCEMKIDGTTDPAAFARKVAARLADWPGLAAAMSFSEAAVRALPDTLMRGQLVLPSLQGGEATFAAVAQNAVRDGIDYLAVHYTDAQRAADLTAQSGTPIVVWTVRTTDDRAAMRPYNPAIIFEHIDPASVTP